MIWVNIVYIVVCILLLLGITAITGKKSKDESLTGVVFISSAWIMLLVSAHIFPFSSADELTNTAWYSVSYSDSGARIRFLEFESNGRATGPFGRGSSTETTVRYSIGEDVISISSSGVRLFRPAVSSLSFEREDGGAIENIIFSAAGFDDRVYWADLETAQRKGEEKYREALRQRARSIVDTESGVVNQLDGRSITLSGDQSEIVFFLGRGIEVVVPTTTEGRYKFIYKEEHIVYFDFDGTISVLAGGS